MNPAQEASLEILLASKKAYLNAKSLKEVELLKGYINQACMSFQVVKTFMGWTETLKVLNQWNPFKERKVAQLLDRTSLKKKKELTKPLEPKQPAQSGSKAPVVPFWKKKERAAPYKIPKKEKNLMLEVLEAAQALKDARVALQQQQGKRQQGVD